MEAKCLHWLLIYIRNTVTLRLNSLLVPKLDLDPQLSHPLLRNSPLTRCLEVDSGAAELVIEDVLCLNTQPLFSRLLARP